MHPPKKPSKKPKYVLTSKVQRLEGRGGTVEDHGGMGEMCTVKEVLDNNMAQWFGELESQSRKLLKSKTFCSWRT